MNAMMKPSITKAHTPWGPEVNKAEIIYSGSESHTAFTTFSQFSKIHRQEANFVQLLRLQVSSPLRRPSSPCSTRASLNKLTMVICLP